MGQILQELKRRNVIRVAMAYAVSAWLLIQVSDTVFPMLRLPDWVATLVAVLLLIGFPVALIFAWAFELTPEGIKREKQVDRDESITQLTGRKLDFVIIAMLVVALGYFGYDKFVLDPARDAELVQATRESVTEQVAESAKSENFIAVLPFVNMSDDSSNEYFSDGVSEEILNLLVKVPELLVTSRSSSFSFKGQNLDIPTMAARLNVAHVLECSVRKEGSQVRITAQLIEVATDRQVWSQSFNREYDWDFTAAVRHLQQALRLNPGDAFILQEAARLETLLGRHNEAIKLRQQSIAIDPVSPLKHIGLGLTLMNANRLEEAADSFRFARSLTPGRPAHWGLGLVLLRQGDAPVALIEMEQQANDFHPMGMALVQHALGDVEASDAALEELINRSGPITGAIFVAEVHAFRGEIDRAFDWLERAYEIRDPILPFMLARPLLANIHDDPRWDSLLDKMGLPH